MIRVMHKTRAGKVEIHSINPAHIARITDSTEPEECSNSVIELVSGSMFYDMRTMSELERVIENHE